MSKTVEILGIIALLALAYWVYQTYFSFAANNLQGNGSSSLASGVSGDW